MAYNVKCTACGNVFDSENKTGNVKCPYCDKEISLSQGIKYYSSFSENSSVKKEAHGEDYRKVNLYLDRIYDLINSENFSEAEEEVKAAFALTDSDYRLYMAMVAVKTKNFTDLNDKTHKPYINKAIEIADSEQKNDIKKIYKDYYDKTRLTAAELGEVAAEEANSKKKKLESGLKTLIPEFMAIDNRNKIFLALFPILFVVGIIIFCCFTFVTDIVWLSFVGLALVAAGAVVFTVWYSSKDKSQVFNSFLDLYDLLDAIELSEDVLIPVYDKFYGIYLKFKDNDPLVTISYETVKLVDMLLKSQNEKIREFIEENKYFSENIPSKYYDEKD